MSGQAGFAGSPRTADEKALSAVTQRGGVKLGSSPEYQMLRRGFAHQSQHSHAQGRQVPLRQYFDGGSLRRKPIEHLYFGVHNRQGFGAPLRIIHILAVEAEHSAGPTGDRPCDGP